MRDETFLPLKAIHPDEQNHPSGNDFFNVSDYVKDKFLNI